MSSAALALGLDLFALLGRGFPRAQLSGQLRGRLGQDLFPTLLAAQGQQFARIAGADDVAALSLAERNEQLQTLGLRPDALPVLRYPGFLTMSDDPLIK